MPIANAPTWPGDPNLSVGAVAEGSCRGQGKAGRRAQRDQPRFTILDLQFACDIPGQLDIR